MKRITVLLALLITVIFASQVMALDYPKPDLDHQAAVERIADAKANWLKNREPSDADTPHVQVIGDYLDLFNTQTLSRTQRLVIITY